MTDLVFVLVYVVCIAWIIALSRSLTATVVLVFGGFTVSGVILQDLGDAGLEVNIGLLRIWLAVTLAVIALAAFLVRQRIATRWSPQSNLILLGLSGGIALAFSLSRLIAPGAPTPLSSVGFFVTRIAAEDNAKWLNATAALANGSAVDVWANVGGPLVLILTFSATVISAISYVLYGAVNEVAVSSGSLLFTELLLIVLAPLALAPLAEKRFKKLNGNQIPWPLILLSGVTLAAGSPVLLIGLAASGPVSQSQRCTVTNHDTGLELEFLLGMAATTLGFLHGAHSRQSCRHPRVHRRHFRQWHPHQLSSWPRLHDCRHHGEIPKHGRGTCHILQCSNSLRQLSPLLLGQPSLSHKGNNSQAFLLFLHFTNCPGTSFRLAIHLTG